MSVEQKIFDDFPQADCHTCHNYWSDQCDGVPVDKSRKCTAYKATRQSDLPLRIEKLEKSMKSTNICVLLLAIALLLQSLVNLLT